MPTGRLYRVMSSINETSMPRTDGAADRSGFAEFVETVDVRLRSALMATFGPTDGRAAAVDALSWAWEHWERVRSMENPVGYLYRVGRTAARRHRGRPLPVADRGVHIDDPSVSPELVAALANLSAQQRTVVILVHAFGWTHRETADLLEMSPSSVQTHVERGLSRLRDQVDQYREHDDAY